MAHQVCFATKTNGQPCTARSNRFVGDNHPEHLHFCGTHKPVYRRMARDVGLGVIPADGILGDRPPVHHTEGRCLSTVMVWHGMPLRRVAEWCPNAAVEGGHLCLDHGARNAARAARAAEQPNIAVIVHTLVHGLLDAEPLPGWRNAANVLAAMDGVPLQARWRAARAYYNIGRVRHAEAPEWHHAPPWRLRAYWNWVLNGREGPEPDLNQPPAQLNPGAPPFVPAHQPGLGALARDSQNVHTRVVSDQTNKATETLLTVKVPETQQTEKTMTLVWLGILGVSYGTYLRVAQDVNRWFNTKDCRVNDDNLYRKLLRGLVAMLNAEKDDERRSELFRRLWEECQEAVGMCCEGHISRLCNVLVGFDEAFQPPVPFGEILQSKMAAIAGLDISDEEKRRQANAFFDEHKTPQEDRVAWLDAF